MRYGGEKRGNSTDRRRRKEWMLKHFGDGTTCSCVHCGTKLTRRTLTADRIVPGASYRRDNIQPACQPCNRARGEDVNWAPTRRRSILDLREVRA